MKKNERLNERVGARSSSLIEDRERGRGGERRREEIRELELRIKECIIKDRRNENTIVAEEHR